MSFDDLFKTPPKKSPKKPKVEKPKEECPYCGRLYTNLNAHLKKCSDNPDNVKKPAPKPKAAAPTVDVGKIVSELREEYEKKLTPDQKRDIKLSAEEAEKIEKIYDFLGGTEGYQFIYKTLSGNKIRGTIPSIIDQCIEWLNKHKTYFLFHRTKWKPKE